MSKWSGLQALGMMAQGAGQYFGTLSTLKFREEQLAQARAEKVADRDYASTVRKEERDLAVIDRDESRAYAKETRANERELALGDRAEARAYAEGQTAEQRTYAESRAADLSAAEQAQKEADTTADNAENDRRSERDAQDAKDLAQEKDRLKGNNGDYKLTEAQLKNLQHFTNGMRGVQNAEKALDAGFGAQGFSGLVAVATDGNYLTNWLGSAQGQQYHQGLREATEAILRIRTGAAAQDQEINRLMKTFEIRPGDSPEVMRQKRQTFTSAVSQMKLGLPKAAIMDAEQYWKDGGEAPEFSDSPQLNDVDAFMKANGIIK